MKFLFIIIYFISPVILFSQDSLSLSNALKTGLENNYQIQIQQKNIEITKNNNSWGMAGAFPVINAGIANQNKYERSDTLESVTGAFVPNIAMNWTLFNGFNAYISKQKLAAIQELSEGNAAILVENTIQAIILGYYYILLQEEKLKVFKKILDLSRDRYYYLLLKQELGSAVTFEVLQEKNNYLADSSNYMVQQLNYSRAIRNFNLILALPEDYTYILTDSLVEPQLNVDPVVLKTNLDNSNKTLLNQYINQEILRKEVKLAQSALYPTLNMQTGYDKVERWANPEPYNFISSGWDYYANFTLSITLFNGSRIRKSIQNAKINERIGQISIEQARQSVNNQYDNAVEFYQVRKQIKELAESRLESAELNLNIAKEKYRSGTINSFNYRDIQLLYINVAIQNIESTYYLYESLTEILRLSGGIISEFE